MNKKRLKKIVLVIGAVFLAVLILAVAAYNIIRLSGKKSLSDDEKSVVAGKNIKGASIYDSFNDKDTEYKYNTDLVNVLVLGIDSDKKVSQINANGDMGQSDALYLVSFNLKKNKINVFGIPRDSMSEVEVYDTNNKLYAISRLQIAVQYAYGNNCERSCELTAKAVSGIMYGIPVDRVCVFNYDAVSVINDAVGGVEVTFENDFTDESGEEIDPEFKKGNTITLTGEQAGYFLRERDCTIAESAMDRLSRQEQYISKLADKFKKKIKSKPLKALDIVSELKKNDSIYTDLSSSEIMFLATMLKKADFSMDNVITLQGNVEMGEEYEEYNLDTSAIRQMILDNFYKKS